MPNDVFDDNYVNRQIFLFSVIDAWTSNDVIRQLLAMDRESNEEITIFINSPGGSVNQMFAIIDTMRMIKSPVRTVGVGVVASAAAIILSSGDTRLISKMAEVMIHEVSGGAFGIVSDMKESIFHADKLQEMMITVLSRNTKRSVQEIKDSIEKTDKYFDANESIAFGLADRLINDEEAQTLKLSESINVEGYIIHGKDVQILREGNYDHPVYGKFSVTEKMMQKMKENFDKNVRGCDISYDYTHDNDNGEKPAAFWVKSLEVRPNSDGKGKGLYARVEFTPMGKKKISEKEYKYSSADIRIDYVDQHGKHHPYVLCGGTLTNRPFIKNMNPIKLSESYSKEVKSMDKKELIAALQGMGVDVVALTSANESLNARVKELENKISELSALPAQKESEIKELKNSLEEANKAIVENEKLSVFNDLVASGKCLPAQKDGIFNTFKTAKEISEFYKDAPVVVSTKRKGAGDEITDDLTEAEQALVNEGAYTREEIIEARKPVYKK